MSLMDTTDLRDGYPLRRALWQMAHTYVLDTLSKPPRRVDPEDERVTKLRDMLMVTYYAGAKRSAAQMAQLDELLVEQALNRIPPVFVTKPK